MFCNLFLCADETLHNSYWPDFESLTLPPYHEQIDYVWTATIRIIDVFWATRVVTINVKIGNVIRLFLDSLIT